MRLLCLAVLLLAAPAAAQDPGARADLDLLSRADAARQFVADTTLPTVVEFADYACSTCAVFAGARGDSLMALHEAGRVNVIYRTYPIPRLLRGFQAAEAAYCAGALGGPDAFKSVHYALFAGQRSWAPLSDPTALFVTYAEAAGLYIPDFRACLARDAMAPLILSDVALSQAVELTGTPTFVVSRPGAADYDKWSGDQPMARFEAALERVGAAPAQ